MQMENEDERNNLIEAWIKYAGELDDAQKNGYPTSITLSLTDATV